MKTEIAEILHQAAELPHSVYKIVDGNDPDWASWYAEWLTNLSELPVLLGTKLVRSELIYLLVDLDKTYTQEKPDMPWEQCYAERFIHHYKERADA